MTIAFNVIDEPWLPLRTPDGVVELFSLSAALARAHEFEGIAEPSPVNLIALYRMLIALVSDAVVEGGVAVDFPHCWERGLPYDDVLRPYLALHRDRFWVFHPEHPFMQVAALRDAKETREKRKSVSVLRLDSASGNNPTVFDHSVDDVPQPLSVDEAVRSMVGLLQFTPGGLVKVFRGSDNAGALANTAAVLPVADRLHRTLLLGIETERDPRFPQDAPGWRSPPLSIAQLSSEGSPSLGLRDRYTRASRAVLLEPERTGGATSVRWLRFGAGHALRVAEGESDPMAATRITDYGPTRVTFSEARAFWRDLGALVPDPDGTRARPPVALDRALSHWASAVGDWPAHLDVIVAGLATDQAKKLRWRTTRVALPASLLDSRQTHRAQYLRDAIAVAEDAFSSLRGTATDAAARSLPNGRSKEGRELARSLVDRSALAMAYFGKCEAGIAELLAALGRDDVDSGLASWRERVAAAIDEAWRLFVASLGTRARVIAALAEVTGCVIGLRRRVVAKDAVHADKRLVPVPPVNTVGGTT